MLVGDRGLDDVEDDLVDQEAIGSDGAADDGLAQAEARLDRDDARVAVRGVQGHGDTRAIGSNHRLHDDSHEHVGSGDALGTPVGDGAGGEQAGPAPLHRVEHRGLPDDPEERVLLSGEARIGGVLRRGARSHGDGRSPPRAAYASAIASRTRSGSTTLLDEVTRAARRRSSTAPRSLVASSGSASTASSAAPPPSCSRAETYACVVTAKPSGTGNSAAMRRSQADRLAADEGDVVAAAVAQSLDELGLCCRPFDEHAHRSAERGVAPVLEGLTVDQAQAGKPLRELLEHDLHLEARE